MQLRHAVEDGVRAWVAAIPNCGLCHTTVTSTTITTITHGHDDVHMSVVDGDWETTMVDQVLPDVPAQLMDRDLRHVRFHRYTSRKPKRVVLAGVPRCT